jgi:hypothetical protein
MLESEGLDFTAEKVVLLVQPIERGVQLSNNCLGFILGDDQFDWIFLYSNCISPAFILCLLVAAAARLRASSFRLLKESA